MYVNLDGEGVAVADEAEFVYDLDLVLVAADVGAADGPVELETAVFVEFGEGGQGLGLAVYEPVDFGDLAGQVIGPAHDDGDGDEARL